MKKNKVLWVGLFSSLLGPLAVAGDLDDSWDEWSDWSYAISLSAGPAWARSAAPQTFYLAPGVTNAYTVDKKKKTALVNGELFLGAEFGFKDATQYQLGLAIGGMSKSKVRGEVLEDADPGQNYDSYYYYVRPARLAVKAKVLADIFSNECIKPYVSGSVGAAYNKATGFTLQPRELTEASRPGFVSKSVTSLSYSLGVGIQAAIAENWQVGVGYEFTNWGKYELEQTRYGGISMSNYYTNGALLNLSYVYS